MHELFAAAGILRPADLAQRLGLTRQYAHRIWSGQQLLSRKMAREIEQATGIPYAALMAAEIGTPPKTPRGRPRKRPADEGQA